MKTPLKLFMAVCVLAALSSCDAGTATVLQTTTGVQTETTTHAVTATETVAVNKSITVTQIIVVTQATTVTVPSNVDYSPVMPDDFYIIYETSWSPHSYTSPYDFMVLLNTKMNILGKPLGLGGYITTGFYIPQDDLRAIYDAIVEYDLASYRGSDMLASDGITASPTLYYKITFRLNGGIYSVLCDSSATIATASYPKLAEFHDMLTDYYYNTDEYQSLPPASAVPS